MSGLSDEEKAMLKDVTAMPGDADESAAKIGNARTKAALKRKDGQDAEKVEKERAEEEDEAVRGNVSPAQFDDDGWGGLPVQMRGE